MLTGESGVQSVLLPVERGIDGGECMVSEELRNCSEEAWRGLGGVAAVES